MARVTVEHILENVENKFELVIVAAWRAHMLSCVSAIPTLDMEKPAVLALREIESGAVNVDSIKKLIVERYRIEQTTGHGSRKAPAPAANSFQFDGIEFDTLATEEPVNRKEKSHDKIKLGNLVEVDESYFE